MYCNSHFQSHCHSSKLTVLLFSFIFGGLILLSLPTGLSDLTADQAALLELRSAVGGRTLLWDSSQQNPCQWAGVHCENNRVTALRLPGVSLSGQLPYGIFGNLTALRTLSLRLNSLSGPLPSDLGSCTELRNLYLQGNHFSSNVPDSMFTLRRLVRLDLAGNNFSGEISPGFNNLTRLRTLYLDNNQLSGSIPELNIPSLRQFNVSFNRLNGSVPKSLASKPDTAFLGNLLCGKPLDSCSSSETPAAIAGIGNGRIPKKENRLSGGAIVGIVIGSILGFIVLLVLLLILCRKKSSKKSRSVDVVAIKHPERDIPAEKLVEAENGSMGNEYSVAAAATAAMTSNGKEESGGEAKKLVFFGNAGRVVFDLEDLLRASAEVLGKGTFGTAYKAVLEAGIVVAVKRLKDVTISEREFREKIESVGAMDHENLIPLRAYYYSREEKLLVYDYMPMGSLSALLHANKGARRTPLNWEIRSGIALGVAHGIDYLHSQGPNISHGNIKSSNIILDKSYKARVSDFSLAQLVGPSSTPNRVAGYRAPEVTDPRKVSQKADVYSFGVLLLELLTGKAPTHSLLNEDGVDLPRWVQSIVQEEWTSEVFDLDLQNVKEEMVQLLQLAIDCAAQHPHKRPSMSEVRMRIENLCRVNLKDDKDPETGIVYETD